MLKRILAKEGNVKKLAAMMISSVFAALFVCVQAEASIDLSASNLQPDQAKIIRNDRAKTSLETKHKKHSRHELKTRLSPIIGEQAKENTPDSMREVMASKDRSRMHKPDLKAAEARFKDIRYPYILRTRK
jgi:hypothetical protein